DPNAGNNSSTSTATVSTQADLAIAKSSNGPVIAGANLTYTLGVTNNGPSDATTVSLADTLPPNTTFVSFTAPAGWTATTPAVGATGTVTAANGSMLAGTSANFT